MAATPQDTARQNQSSQPRQNEHPPIDRTAPAGSENSLGAQSVRDGRPSTDDSTVEAIDELGPGPAAPPDSKKP